eukprot:TRINITY_DN31975_c0_g1_i1.p1 TRINITY_DN31975_c0_g1~~TRINITY_DN31975_c0_g1_i1.p1  ORF type:complete len:311 (-),score=82.20 TRINITY_DN31975_c0_g1_i1:57-989(-)
MGLTTEYLVNDRMAEFTTLAQSKNTLNPEVDVAPPAPKKKVAESGDPVFMREFFDAVGLVAGNLNKGKANVKLMRAVLQDSLMATTQDKQKAIEDRLNELVQETGELIKYSKVQLELLKTKSETDQGKRCTQAEAKIQANMRQAMAKKQQQLLIDFQKVQLDYKHSLERRQERELAILMPETTENERVSMIEAGQTTEMVLQKKMAGAHALLLDEVQNVRDKHKDILRLEQNIADLSQMFQEMAVLVDAQGEMLDAIEVHVNRAKESTGKAEKELITTRKYQMKNRKMMCCIMVVLMILLLVILGPILLK